MRYARAMKYDAEELERFKTLNFVEYAFILGYSVDSASSSRRSVTMRHPNGDKIIIARQANNHWTYFAVHDPTDHGTIIDFCQRRTGGNLGQVRKTLREFLGSTPLPDRRAESVQLQPVRRDYVALRAKFEGMQSLAGHRSYLVDERFIPMALLTSPRFAGTVRIDDRGAAIFPHTDNVGDLTGWEIKNTGGFSGFAPGGTKSLWRSAFNIKDRRLVVAESAIDGLSYAALFPDDHARYVSIAGRMNPDQPALLTSVIQSMQPGSMVVAAVDNDDAGHEMADQFKTLVIASGRLEGAFELRGPDSAGDDWNAVLGKRRARTQHRGFER